MAPKRPGDNHPQKTVRCVMFCLPHVLRSSTWYAGAALCAEEDVLKQPACVPAPAVRALARKLVHCGAPHLLISGFVVEQQVRR